MAACPAKQELTGSRLWRIQSDKIKLCKIYGFRCPSFACKAALGKQVSGVKKEVSRPINSYQYLTLLEVHTSRYCKKLWNSI
jgi:hypothetical protein